MSGIREEVYVFDDPSSPTPTPVSVSVTDSRVLADEQDRIVALLRYMRRRALSLTDDEALDDMEGSKKDKVLSDHRKAVRNTFKAIITEIRAATTLAALDAIEWGAQVDALYTAEFPDTLGQKDPSKPKKQKESKSTKADR